MLYKVRSAYHVDLPKREEIAKQNDKKRMVDRLKNITQEELFEGKEP